MYVCMYRLYDQKQLHIGNIWPRFAYSLYNLTTIKVRLHAGTLTIILKNSVIQKMDL